MKLLIATGSSGGHIFPALALADVFCSQHPQAQVMLVVPRRHATGIVLDRQYKVSYISIRALASHPWWKAVSGSFFFLVGVVESLAVVARFGPDVAIGFGSLSCIPVLVWARLLGKRVVIHEQNVVPGRANRLLAFLAHTIALSFEKTAEYFPGKQRRIVVTGNPLRAELRAADPAASRRFFGLDEKRFTVLVTGGSQGSASVNEGCKRLFSSLKHKDRIQLIHLCGSRDERSLEEFYRSRSIPAAVLPFCRQMSYAYSAANIAISRAGATTIQELIAFSLPAVLVPYPYAYRHQWANAALVAHQGAAVLIEDGCIGSQQSAEVLDGLIADPQKLQRMKDSFAPLCRPQAALILAEAVL